MLCGFQPSAGGGDNVDFDQRAFIETRNLEDFSKRSLSHLRPLTQA
jgi:hypothetical protein